jgi:hypothetical protein
MLEMVSTPSSPVREREREKERERERAVYLLKYISLYVSFTILPVFILGYSLGWSQMLDTWLASPIAMRIFHPLKSLVVTRYQ